MPIVIFATTLFGCETFKFSDTREGEVVATVGEKKLYLNNVVGLEVEGITFDDSVQIVNRYAENWIKEQLSVDYALVKFSHYKSEVDKLVDDYRRSLYIDYFEREYTKKVDNYVSYDEIKEYYDKYNNFFVMTENMVKAKVIVVSKKYSDLRSLRYKFNSSRASVYADIKSLADRDGFLEKDLSDNWYNFSTILDYIPFGASTLAYMMKKDGVYEYSDETNIYLVKIEERKLKGSIAPLSVVEGVIRNSILTERKSDRMREVKDSIYYDAINSGAVLFYGR